MDMLESTGRALRGLDALLSGNCQISFCMLHNRIDKRYCFILPDVVPYVFIATVRSSADGALPLLRQKCVHWRLMPSRCKDPFSVFCNYTVTYGVHIIYGRMDSNPVTT